jgi:hypothetical protein
MEIPLIQNEYNKVINFTRRFGWPAEDVEDFVQWLYERSIRLKIPFKATSLRHRVIDYKRHMEGDKKNKTTKTRQAVRFAKEVLPSDLVFNFEDSEIYKDARLSERVQHLDVVTRAMVILHRKWGMEVEEISYVFGFLYSEVDAILRSIY